MCVFLKSLAAIERKQIKLDNRPQQVSKIWNAQNVEIKEEMVLIKNYANLKTALVYSIF